MNAEGDVSGTFLPSLPFSALEISILPCHTSRIFEKAWSFRLLDWCNWKIMREVVRLFGDYEVEVFSQKDMDEMIQAALYTKDTNVFIPHQDRPMW